ncbi:MAG: Mini-ribonuclease 3 [Clostridia bacterium]|nr:Mini-ribonuclease 3 [Clostridia bacterium]
MGMLKGNFTFSSPISTEEALKMHPMTLAFIGDAVQSLYARTRISLSSTSKTGILHKEVTKVVKAVHQAQVAERLMEELDDIEADVFRRARNCQIQTSAKHAERGEYRRASGFEAVLGYLYITGQNNRLSRFLDKSFEE